MEVKITMTVEEFESYRAYQRDMAAARAEVRAPLDDMRGRLNRLCNALLYAISEDKGSTGENPLFSIVGQKEMAEAVDLAEDWVS